jgi:hypothetical protein
VSSEKIDVSVDEVRRVFDLLDKVNALFHQPLKYDNSEVVKAFAEDNYKEISELYYNVVWEWLPEAVKAEIEDC